MFGNCRREARAATALRLEAEPAAYPTLHQGCARPHPETGPLRLARMLEGQLRKITPRDVAREARRSGAGGAIKHDCRRASFILTLRMTSHTRAMATVSKPAATPIPRTALVKLSQNTCGSPINHHMLAPRSGVVASWFVLRRRWYVAPILPVRQHRNRRNALGYPDRH